MGTRVVFAIACMLLLGIVIFVTAEGVYSVDTIRVASNLKKGNFVEFDHYFPVTNPRLSLELLIAFAPKITGNTNLLMEHSIKQVLVGDEYIGFIFSS